MAQTIKTFFDLGGAKRIADPRVAEEQRQQQLAIEEARRQDALRAALAGEGLQRQQLAQSQQATMARLGLDKGRLGLDREKFAFGREEAGRGREHNMLLEQLKQTGLDTRQQAGFDHAAGMAGDQREFLQGESALDRGFQSEQKGLDRDLRESLSGAEIDAAMQRLLMQESGRDKRHSEGLKSGERLADKQITAADKRSELERQLRLFGIVEQGRRSDQGLKADERRLASEERRHSESNKIRSENSTLDRALRTRALDDKAKADKSATAEAARSRVVNVMGNRPLTDPDTIRDLARLADVDPSARAIIQGEMANRLKRALAQEQREYGEGFGGFLNYAGRSAGHVLTLSGMDSPDQKLARERDTLLRLLEGRK